jgi:hypothetical protein
MDAGHKRLLAPPHPQASIGTALLGFLTAADVLVGGYVLVMDELIKVCLACTP